MTVVEHGIHALQQCVFVSLWDKDASLVVDNLCDAAHSSRKHWNTRGKGFHDDARKVLEVGEEHEEVGVLIGLCHLGRGLFAMENDTVRKVVLLDKSLEFRRIIVMDDVQLKVVAVLS